MADVIKHVFKYQELRQTLFLNLAAKDDYGRHRGQVLYGMKASPTGTQITIGAGAVYTPYGTKFYWDVPTSPSSTIDFASVVQLNGNDVLDAANESDRPIIVAILAEVSPAEAERQPEIEDASDLSASSVQFNARVVATSDQTTVPLLNLTPVNPVTMDAAQTPDISYDPVSTHLDPAARVLPNAATAANEALQRFEVLLGFVIIGVDSAGLAPSVLESGGDWADGVTYVPPLNAFEAISDFLGHDVLMGRTADSSVGAPIASSPSLNQVATKYQSGGVDHVPYQTPRFGTTTPGALPDPWAVNWSTYRPPNFMRDGEQLVWQLRRLDYFLRLWMDRTGDQELVNLIQDGVGSNLDIQAPLYQILKEFTGGTSSNQNVLNWLDDLGGAYVNNQVLKSGFIKHGPIETLVSTGTTYGDHHRGAIYAVDLGLWHILTDILGMGLGTQAALDRDVLRDSSNIPRAANTALHHTGDGPIGHLPSAGTPEDDRPTFTGSGLVTAYLDNEPLYPAIADVAQRANQSGQSLIRNGNFAIGDTDNEVAGTLPFWTITGGWTRTDLLAPLGLKQVEFVWGAGQSAVQRLTSVDFPEILEAGTILSVSILIHVDSGEAKVAVVGYDNAPSEIFRASSPAFAADTEYRAHAFSFRVDDPTGLEHLDLLIHESGGAAATVNVAGVWFGVGHPPENPVLTNMPHEFLSRDGGEDAPLRGDLLLGTHEIYGGALRADSIWNENPPALSGATDDFVDGSLDNASGMVAAVDELLQRTNESASSNVLRNPNFAESAADLDTDTGDNSAPTSWIFTDYGGAGILSSAGWTRYVYGLTTGRVLVSALPDDEETAGYELELALVQDTGLYQVVFAELANFNEAIALGRRFSASIMVDGVSAGDALDFELVFDQGGTEHSIATQTIAAGYRGEVTMSVDASALSAVTGALFLRIGKTTAGSRTIKIYGVWAGFGQPQVNAHGADEHNFVSRGGGKTSAMRDDLHVGTATSPHKIRYVASPNKDDPDYANQAVNVAFFQATQTGIFGNGDLGDVVNPVFSNEGIYDFNTLEINTNTSLPWFTMIRVLGDCTISASLTSTQRPQNPNLAYSPNGSPVTRRTFINQDTQRSIYDHVFLPSFDGASIINSAHGGSSVGISGNQGRGGRGELTSGPRPSRVNLNDLLYPLWKTFLVPLGGQGGDGGDSSGNDRRPGGVLILMVGGNLTMTGGTLSARGNPWQSGSNAGAGAGGTVLVHCLNTWTDGIVDVSGDKGGSDGGTDDDGGGGAAGFFCGRVRDTAGAITINARGGNGGGDSAEAGSGSHCYFVYVEDDADLNLTWNQNRGTSYPEGTGASHGSHEDVQIIEEDFLKLTVPWPV